MSVYDIQGNELATETDTESYRYWNNKINYPYWVLYLDCGRKYFSVANVNTLIDLMSVAGFNQINLHFSENEGFRFALDDMTVRANGTVYNLASCLGGSENPTKWYTETDMDEIISYAQKKGIDIVPCLDVPGHMGRILSAFPGFKLEGTSTLNIKSSSAVNFAKALIEKYARYFSSRGCKWFNMGYDEIMGWSVGFPQFYNNGEFQYVVDFANEISKTIKSVGMIPRAFNEPFHYNNDPDYFVDRDIEVLYYDGSTVNETLATPPTLQKLGYTMINCNEKYYWVNNSSRQVTAAYLESADLLKGFDVASTPKDGQGAVFCIWCDYKSNASDNGDNGNAVVTAVTPLISAFGTAIQNALNGEAST